MSEVSNLDHARNFVERIQKVSRPKKQPYTGWYLVGQVGDVALGNADCEFENGWSNVGAPYPPFSYHLTTDAKVYLRGAVAGGTVGTVITTLPDYARPEYTERFFVATEVAGVGATVDVNLDGTVVFVG
jgi:hypothetical protein